MSEELTDEVDALNSIYGENSLAPSEEDPTIYILRLPSESSETSSLRLRFPLLYPAEAPVILGTHSSGERSRRGAAARDLELFRDAVGAVFQPGQVCLFDAIDELKRLLELRARDEEELPTDGAMALREEAEQTARPLAGPIGDQIGPEPPWIMSEVYSEMKSSFVARCAHVTSTAEAEGFVRHLLASDKRVRTATHNITAWRIRGPNNTSFQDCDDDGETAAGGRLLHLMQLMDLWDTMVVVTRWYGGQKLGPRRFAVINQVARDAFIRAGLVSEPPSKKKGHSK